MAMALTVFLVVTAEMAPVGLLTPIGAALGVSEGTAGLTLTATGVVAAVAGAVLPLGLGRLDRRVVLVGLALLMTVAGLVSAWAPTFEVLMAGRVLTGISMGGVWLLTVGMAPRLVPEKSVGPATALIFSGIAVASVLGIPATTALGELVGWRWAFAGIGLFALALAVLLGMLLPSLPADQPVRFHDIAATFRLHQIRVGLLLTLLLVTGHFASYTYVRPLLEKVTGIGPALISTLLLTYGVAGVLGNFVSGSRRSTSRVVAGIATGIALATLLFNLGAGTATGALLLLLLWGFAYGGVTVTTQTWQLKAAPHATEPAAALLVGVFNGSIALGAFVGGQVADHVGTSSVLWLTGLLAVLALLVVLANGRQLSTRSRRADGWRGRRHTSSGRSG